MSIWYWILVFIILMGAGIYFIRMSPIAPSEYHLPIASQKIPVGQNVYTLIDDQAPVFDVDAQTAARIFDRIVMNSPRTHHVDGSVESGRISYVQRSKIMGFPDIITVEFHSEKSQTRLEIISRSRYGKRDFGVNKMRVDDWLSQFQDALVKDGEAQ